MVIGLVIILAFVLVLPFAVKQVEHSLELFLFIMGLLATIVSGVISVELISHIFTNYLLYMITLAVLVAGILFKISVNKIKWLVAAALKKIPFQAFIFLLIVVLGLASSMITAIIAALVLSEIIHALPLKHKSKVKLAVISCFSIGLGAALTPVGEPLSTITISILKVDFWYLVRQLGAYVIPGILVMGLLGAYYTGKLYEQEKAEESSSVQENPSEQIIVSEEEKEIRTDEDLKAVFLRAGKVFLFVIALEMLGAGFKPLINMYLIHLDSRILYWLNMVSAVLDNATLAAAELSPAMTLKQVQAVLMGLLVSGGMLIPGNIPNIISASKLKIQSKEWAYLGLPLGLALLCIYFVAIFILS